MTRKQCLACVFIQALLSQKPDPLLFASSVIETTSPSLVHSSCQYLNNNTNVSFSSFNIHSDERTNERTDGRIEIGGLVCDASSIDVIHPAQISVDVNAGDE